jgi:hypothetical protein
MDPDPWLVAWTKLKTHIDTGATEQEVTDYARELGAQLPMSPDSHAARALAIQHVITDILQGG